MTASPMLPGMEDEKEFLSELPDEIAQSLSILAGGPLPGFDNFPGLPRTETVTPGSLQAKFIEERSKTLRDYTISDMLVRVFDLSIPEQAADYADFASLHFARMMSNPKEFRFSETPVQIVPIENGVRAIVVAKSWTQKAVPAIKQPRIDKIPKGGLKRQFEVSLTPTE